jgi:hypothetical protein
MYGTIKKIEASERAIPTINIEIEITNDEQKDIYIVGYSIDLSLCNVPIGSIQKFRTTNLEQGALRVSYRLGMSEFIHIFSPPEQGSSE